MTNIYYPFLSCRNSQRWFFSHTCDWTVSFGWLLAYDTPILFNNGHFQNHLYRKLMESAELKIWPLKLLGVIKNCFAQSLGNIGFVIYCCYKLTGFIRSRLRRKWSIRVLSLLKTLFFIKDRLNFVSIKRENQRE